MEKLSLSSEEFLKFQRKFNLALTFDDVTMEALYSEILPPETSIETLFTKNIKLKIPICSAAMDTVTECEMAIAIAKEGGIGVIHKNLSIEKQSEMVALVKRWENGFIHTPMVLSPEDEISKVVAIKSTHGYKSVPITEDGTLQTKVVGMVTKNDYTAKKHGESLIKEKMTPLEKLFVAYAPLTLSEATDKLEESHHSKLLVLNTDGTLYALVTKTDLEKNEEFPNACKDEHKRLRVAAAVSPGKDFEERVYGLVSAGVDALVVDTAHGHSKGVMDCIKFIKENYPQVDVVGGNIATAKAAEDLIAAGADAVKVGIGPGSICTTRVIAGVGIPQFSAILEISSVCHKHGIPCIADGGIRESGDIAKALAAGASSVMIGSLLAATKESPGEIILFQGKRYKQYRGMGSVDAMKKGSSSRYGQEGMENDKFVPEGIEGQVLLKGDAASVLYQLCGGVRAALGYTGSKDIRTLWKNARFVRVSPSGVREAHPHDITITKESPNYHGK